jgi:hypothetical protein
MLFREIITVYSDIHTQPINTICGQNAEKLNVKVGGTYTRSDQKYPEQNFLYRNY